MSEAIKQLFAPRFQQAAPEPLPTIFVKVRCLRPFWYCPIFGKTVDGIHDVVDQRGEQAKKYLPKIVRRKEVDGEKVEEVVREADEFEMLLGDALDALALKRVEVLDSPTELTEKAALLAAGKARRR
jgi:hypothetical protein